MEAVGRVFLHISKRKFTTAVVNRAPTSAGRLPSYSSVEETVKGIWTKKQESNSLGEVVDGIGNNKNVEAVLRGTNKISDPRTNPSDDKRGPRVCGSSSHENLSSRVESQNVDELGNSVAAAASETLDRSPAAPDLAGHTATITPVTTEEELQAGKIDQWQMEAVEGDRKWQQEAKNEEKT